MNDSSEHDKEEVCKDSVEKKPECKEGNIVEP